MDQFFRNIERVSIGELIKNCKSYQPTIDENRIKKAYHFAKNAHSGQIRGTGQDYILHPLNTANILTKLKVDEDTIVGALLHDVVEDCDICIEEIEKRFGSRVAVLVNGVTKLSKVKYQKIWKNTK